MKNVIRLFPILALLFNSSCHIFDETNLQLIWMEAPVYQCCNAWDDIGEYTDPIEDRVSRLFLSEGILVLEDKLDDTAEPLVCIVCCRCPTEYIIKVRIPIQGKAKAEEWGFRAS